MALIVTPRVSGDTVVIDLKGRLWILDLPLRDRVHALLSEGCRFFVLNLQDVEHMDSSGLGQLISIWTSVRTTGGNVAVLRPSDRVRRLLTLTHLNVVVDIHQDEEKAKTSVRRDSVA